MRGCLYGGPGVLAMNAAIFALKACEIGGRGEWIAVIGDDEAVEA